jgi:hypothetical protein
MSNVTPFRDQPSEFTGMNDEKIDKHPLRAYWQGYIAGTLKNAETLNARDEFWKGEMSRAIQKAMWKAALKAWELAPPKAQPGPRGRRTGSRVSHTWGELRTIYVWVMRQRWVHGRSTAAACAWLAKNGANHSQRTLQRRFTAIESFLKADAEGPGEFAQEIDTIKHCLLLESLKQRESRGEQLPLNDPSAIAIWKNWTSPLAPNPLRRQKRRAK